MHARLFRSRRGPSRPTTLGVGEQPTRPLDHGNDQPPVVSVSPRDGAYGNVTDTPQKPNDSPTALQAAGHAAVRPAGQAESSLGSMPIELPSPHRTGPPALMGPAAALDGSTSSHAKPAKPIIEFGTASENRTVQRPSGSAPLSNAATAGVSSASRSLTDAIAQQLRSLIDQAQQQQKKSTEASALLQERLMLAARMLKAGQPLLEHGDRLNDDLQLAASSADRWLQQLNAALRDTEQFSDDTAATIESRVEQIAARALSEFDQAVRTRLDEAGRIEQRMADVMDRAERLTAMVESAEVNITVLAHRAAEMVRRAEAQAAQAATTAAQCEESRTSLAESLLHTDDRIEQQEARCEVIRSSIDQSLARASDAQQSLTQQIDRASSVAAALLEAVQIAEPILTMSPSTPLAAHADLDGSEPTSTRPDMLVEHADGGMEAGDMKATPELLHTMLAQMQQTIISDMSRMTDALSKVAARVDALAANNSKHASDAAAEACGSALTITTPTDTEAHPPARQRTSSAE